jgi:hypothetical protein
MRGVRRHGEARGVHPQEGQGVARDEFNDDSGRRNHDDWADHDDGGDHDNPREDTALPGLMVVGAEPADLVRWGRS